MHKSSRNSNLRKILAIGFERKHCNICRVLFTRQDGYKNCDKDYIRLYGLLKSIEGLYRSLVLSFLSLEVFLFRKASYDPPIKYSNFCETSQWIIKDVVTCHIVQLSLCIISRNHTRIKPTIDKMHMLANDENSVRRNSTYSSIVTMTQQFKFKFAKAGLPERRGVGGGGRIN